MSNKAITWAYKQRTLGTDPMKVGHKAVLVALGDFADQDHSCFPTITALADMTSMSPTAVKSNLADLIDAGYVVREERRRADGSRISNRYYLAVDGPFTSDDPGTESVPGQEPDSDPPPAGFRPTPSRIPTHPQPDSVPISKNPQENPQLNPYENPHSPAPELATLIEPPAGDTIPTVDELFDRFWQVWPRRAAKKAARAAFEKALITAARQLRAGGVPLSRPATPVDAAEAITTSARWWAGWWADVEHRPLDKIPHPATWLNGERWTDTRPDPAQVRETRPQTRTERDLDVVARYAAREAAEQAAAATPRELER